MLGLCLILLSSSLSAKKPLITVGKDECFIINSKEVIYDGKKENGEVIKLNLPIYRGTEEPATYSDLKSMVMANNEYLLNFCYYKNKEQTRKELLFDIINFYKKNLLKNIDTNKPSLLAVEDNEYIIYYDFLYEGVPGHILIMALDATNLSYHFGDVRLAQLKNNNLPIFLVLNIGKYSSYKK
ncbi:hypothetical protein LPTSP3_g05930 [Leptospira kobayashii]|uniref:Lipoprotein n=2 Tax=Leptospira kobayashii TaxID=1917830 RepID=A0ABN6KA11_9LEPT|nr:hypothetical protein LPTSP3_g05930 [Leptospira kobayashii]